jgi:DNA-binding GntR family transcriptional regulator
METRLQQTNLRDQALEVLKLRLISGDLAPGQIYSAASLASELGVSNSPVREAMLTLVNQGLMETVRNRGFRVVPLSDKERRNMYDLRLLVEIPSMARLASMKAAVAAHKDEYSRIAAEIVRCAKKGDIVGYLDADRRFHIGLLSILGNDHLTAIVENLRDQSRQYGLKALSESGALVKSAEEHQPILDAIVAGDQKLTARLMTEHLSHLVTDWA